MTETQLQEMLITKDMTIGDVVQQYPNVTDTLLANGVHCVGCGARFFETLEMGFKGHGMSDEQVETIVKQLNVVAKKAPAVAKGEVITLTESAAAKLKEILKSEGKEGYALRVQVVKTGCANSYGLDFDNTQAADDTAVEMHGVKLLVDKNSLPQVKGANIDYVEGEHAGFRISNSNKSGGGCGSGSCGCG
jgi:iron-sulfur cluster assembly protein